MSEVAEEGCEQRPDDEFWWSRGSPRLAKAKPKEGASAGGQLQPRSSCREELEDTKPQELPNGRASPAPEGGWVSADESSGYESESAASCIPSPPGKDEPQQRRARTAFTPEQVGKLEKTFKRQKYVGAAERKKLAAALQLSEIQLLPRLSHSRILNLYLRPSRTKIQNVLFEESFQDAARWLATELEIPTLSAPVLAKVILPAKTNGLILQDDFSGSCVFSAPYKRHWAFCRLGP
ncbi:Homeobox protein vent1B [Chelonia mydas]|uniref:Homeobox protein vent1B n=1 Tax=Chelonia mydas TaxID=8469 RepID=M7CBS0_CHEMY|nr:Homeobox protein vent1B [Chelonia mydas]